MDKTEKIVLFSVAGLILVMLIVTAVFLMTPRERDPEPAAVVSQQPVEVGLPRSIPVVVEAEPVATEAERHPTTHVESTADESVAPKLTMLDFISMSNEEKLNWCESAETTIGDPRVNSLELFYELSSVKPTNKDLVDVEIRTYIAIVAELLKAMPLGSFSGTGKDQTTIFACGRRRFVTVEWETNEDFHFSLFEYDGTIKEANVVSSSESGRRNLWIDRGIYYLDVYAEGAWKVTIHRSKQP